MPARTVTPDGLVAISPKFRKRFYEPIALLTALVTMVPGAETSAPSDPRADLSLSAEQAFQCYVYKLAQVCDNERGGSTVTSFAVLREPDRIRYVFASNGMDPEQLADVKAFSTSILTALRRVAAVVASDERAVATLTDSIRRDILAFNKPRLDYYIKEFSSGLDDCSSRYVSEDAEGSEGSPDAGSAATPSPQETQLRRVVERLREGCASVYTTNHDAAQGYIEGFLDCCLTLIECIDRVDRSPLKKVIERAAKDGQMDRSECWHKFRHFAGRLLSMYRAVDFLVDATHRWRGLFEEEFSVEAVPPSSPAQQPLYCKSRTVHEVIDRMTGDGPTQAKYKAHADALESHGVSDELSRQCTRDSFLPIVHSEVLLADWLRRDGDGLRPSRFFNGWSFIGCSKPTCRLCQYYFDSPWGPGGGGAGGVQLRPSHRNVYPNWRVPDVRESDGPPAVRERERVMTAVLERVRVDVFRTLEQRVPERKRYDSNTSSILPGLRPMFGSDFGLSELLAGQIEGLSIAESRRGLVPLRVDGRNPAITEGTNEDEDEDEDGGASLA